MKLLSHIAAFERQPVLPQGAQERFKGYGIIGSPFLSGHILAMRRFPASSIGPGYTILWHRDPAGVWTFYADVEAEVSCTRYFSKIVHRSVMTPIDLQWQAPDRLRIAVQEAGLVWEVRLRASLLSRMMNALCALLPEQAWQNTFILRMMGAVAQAVFGLGKVRLNGHTPNGYQFTANPLRIWLLGENRAWLNGMDLGLPGPLREQAHLGDVYIPQRAVFILGQVFFETLETYVTPPISEAGSAPPEGLSGVRS